jgi:flagellar M-ring protein FliF
VHIVLPERSLFVADQRPATASVVLQMRPGRALGSSEIAGVAHLISGAVEGLDKENIVIVDTSGGVLFDGRDLEDGTGIGASSSQLALQRTYEQAIERDAQQLLDQALGPGKSAVSVRAILNFDRLETETEAFTPGIGGDQVQRSSTTVTETYSTDGDASTGAVPGAVANIPGADTSLPVPAGSSETSESGSGTNYARTESTFNFEVGRTVTRSIQAVGRVERLSVSLLLDESVTEEQATALMEAVSAAAGVDADRGDTIVVSRLPFDRTAVADARAAFAEEASTAQILGYVRIALPVLVLAVAFFFFRMLMRSVNAHSAYRLVEAPQGMLAAPDGSMPVALPQARSGGAPLPPAPAPEDMQSQVEQQVTKLAETSPDTVANVVQSWLREE